jgi:hypothetical protein
MKNIFFTSLLLTVPAAMAQQADSCFEPTEYHPPGTSTCIPCNAIANQRVQPPAAEVFCTAGDSDRKFNPANADHCKGGYWADTSGVVDECKPITLCTSGTNYETSAPTKDADRVCSPVSPACDGATHFESSPPSVSSNRVCTPLTACVGDEYIRVAHGVSTDRTCTPRDTCDSSTEYQNNADVMGDSDNRLCALLEVCGNSKYESTAPTPTSDRDCTTIQDCVQDISYEVAAPTATSDRDCSGVVTACSGTEFETDAPTLVANRVCAPITQCVGDEYISVAHSPTSDRTCTPRDICAATEYISNEDPLALDVDENRICTTRSKACSLYNPVKFQASAATPTRDVVCQDYTQCVIGTNYESVAPTATTDRVCGHGVDQGDCAQTVDDTTGEITGLYQSAAATLVANRVCSPIINCAAGKYQSVAPTATTNRQCGHTVSGACDALDEFESAAPTSLSDRVCTDLTVCVQGSTYQTTPPTVNSDRVCSSVTPGCDGINKYQTTAPTLTVNRVCSDVLGICPTATKYQSVAPNPTINRVCADIDTCDGSTTYEPNPISTVAGQYAEQRICTPTTVCGNEQYQVSPPDVITDRVCADWSVCGAADVSTAGVDNYQTIAPSGYQNRVCSNQPAACTAAEYESVIGDALTKRVCLAKKLSCPPGQFLIKSVDGSQAHNIDNQCDVCPEALIPHVVSTSVTCEDICGTIDHPINIQTVSTQCSIATDASNNPLLNLDNNPFAYTPADASSFAFAAFSCRIGYYIDGQTCTTCLDPNAGFKVGSKVVCTDPTDVQSFICEPGNYIVRDEATNTYSCTLDSECNPDDGTEHLFWSQLPVSCDLPANDDAALCEGVDKRVCTLLTVCGADEEPQIGTPGVTVVNGKSIKTSDRVCVPINTTACPTGQYADGPGVCEQCSDGLSNELDRALATECEKVGNLVRATACKQGFKLHNHICVFDTGVEEHHINPSANCKFQKLSDVFDFEWTFVHSKATNADFNSSLKFRDFRQTQYYLGKTTATFNLKQFGATKDSYKYFSIAGTQNSTNYKNFAKTEIASATEVFDVVCFVKPAYPDLLSNTYQTANIAAEPFLSEGCTEIKYITPFSYDSNDPEWTQLQTTPVVSAAVPTNAQYTKSVGVSSKCGTTPQPTIHDVFAWSTLKTTYDEVTNFKLEINLSDLNLGSTPFVNPIFSNLTVEGIEFEGNVEVFDLLYISGDYESQDKVGTSAVDSVVFTDVIAPNGPHNSGNVKMEGSVAHKCTVDLSVTSPNSDFHCFDSTGIAPRVSNSYSTTHLNQGASPSTCSAAITSNCVPTINAAPTVTDSRKCIDDETYGVKCATALQPVQVDALLTRINVKSVIIDAIRLRDTHQFPKGHASGTFDATAFQAATDEFNCDDAACTSDPYLVLEEASGRYEHTCKWSSADFPETPSGTVITSGALDNGNDHVFTSNCAPTGATSGSISSTAIRLPGKIFPQFYVYGITTFSKSPTTGGLPNTLVNGDALAGRRLGGRNSPKLETKTVFVVSPQKVIAK